MHFSNFLKKNFLEIDRRRTQCDVTNEKSADAHLETPQSIFPRFVPYPKMRTCYANCFRFVKLSLRDKFGDKTATVMQSNLPGEARG